MMQIGIQPLSSASQQRSPAVPAEPVCRQIGNSPDTGGPHEVTAAEDQILFVSPPPLPFPRVYPGL
jgi:hypothetical protein